MLKTSSLVPVVRFVTDGLTDRRTDGHVTTANTALSQLRSVIMVLRPWDVGSIVITVSACFSTRIFRGQF